MADLSGKVALVTGATRGLGKGIAIGLGEAGATVYITGRTTADSKEQPAPGTLEKTAAAVNAAGGKCIPVQVDHANDAQVETLFERITTEQNGQLDVLVNNAYAGVQALKDAYGEPFWKHSPALWDAGNNVGLRSHYVASIHAARLMTPRKQGLICTISSWGGLAYIFGAAYGSGKAANDRLAADMAVELKPFNVASISLWPGIVATELMSEFFAESTDNPVGDGYNLESPLLTGRAIAALAADPNVMGWSGKMQIVAELAERYGLQDEDGTRPASLRSLRFALPLGVPALRPYAHWIPNFKIPWWLLVTTTLAAPKI
ncbi:short-chain dehydrogenase [filamentous cyanobacterium CCP5]|nr:short-chain dehydrogenase [filamentous cyanobacterium CCP5]